MAINAESNSRLSVESQEGLKQLQQTQGVVRLAVVDVESQEGLKPPRRHRWACGQATPGRISRRVETSRLKKTWFRGFGFGGVESQEGLKLSNDVQPQRTYSFSNT